MSKGIIFRNHQNEKIYPCAYYPIGSIFLSFANTNPSEYFGGEWEKVKGKFLLGADDETYKVGNTGGEIEHKLTVAEMPSHSHGFNGVNDGASMSSQYGNYPIRMYQDKTINWSSGSGILNTGGNQPHNNMPPYIAVYIWRRVT